MYFKDNVAWYRGNVAFTFEPHDRVEHLLKRKRSRVPLTVQKFDLQW